MSKQDDDEQNAGVMLPRPSMRAEKAYLLALVERWLRPADQLDYLIRQWVIAAVLTAQAPSAGSRFGPRCFDSRQRAVERSSSSEWAAPPCGVRS
jgi:hypothetical protein